MAPRNSRKQGFGFRIAADGDLEFGELAVRSEPKNVQGFERIIAELTEASRSGVESARVSLVQFHFMHAVNLYTNGDLAAALEKFEAVNQSAKAGSEFRIVSRCHRAWILATAQDASLRNLKAARNDAELIRKETQSSTINWLPLLVLAVCHAENDAFTEAAQRARDARARASNDPIVRQDLKRRILRTCGELIESFSNGQKIDSSSIGLPYPTAGIGL